MSDRDRNASVHPRHEATLRDLGLTPGCLDVATGRLPVPVASFTYPPAWYGYPPALVPFWSEGFVYTGLWHHWFTDRPPSFVRLSVRDDHRLLEVARTPEQFVAYATIVAIVAHDALRPATAAFAERAGVRDVAAIDALTLASGDDPRGFPALPEFRTATPLAALSDPGAYDGWFPVPTASGGRAWWATASALELPPEVRTRVPLAAAAASPWLATPDAPAVYRAALATGDLRGAWLALNGPGWTLDRARDALRQLDAAACVPAFSARCAAWLEASAGQDGAW